MTEACVPISRLAECITETEEDLAASGLPAAILGHVGDGNFHVNIPLHPADAQEIAAAKRCSWLSSGTVKKEGSPKRGWGRYLGCKPLHTWTIS